MVVNAGIYVNVLREQFWKVNGQLNKEEFEQREKLCGENIVEVPPFF